MYGFHFAMEIVRLFKKMTLKTKSVLDIFQSQFAVIYQAQMEKRNKKVW